MLQPEINFKQYLVTVPALTKLPGVGPNNPKRVYLRVQNTGANPLLFRFGEDIQLDQSDIVIIAGDSVTFNDPCVTLRTSFYSVAGTTVSIVEGFEVR